jgi:hypothetical protein
VFVNVIFINADFPFLSTSGRCNFQAVASGSSVFWQCFFPIPAKFFHPTMNCTICYIEGLHLKLSQKH